MDEPAAAPVARSTPRPVARPRVRPTRRRSAGRLPSSPRLVDTPGPDPAALLATVRLTVGTVVGVHGLAGELKVRLATDEPDHLRHVQRVWIGDEVRSRRVIALRLHAGQALLRLEDISSPEQALRLRGQAVRIAGADARPLAEGEFFHFQLIGLEVVTEDGASVGRVTDIMETGANDVFVVAPPYGPDVLIPNIVEVVLDVDPTAGRMVVRLQDYLN